MALHIDDINRSAKAYFTKLNTFVNQYNLTPRVPSTIAWKVTDINAFCDDLSGFLSHKQISQCHIGFVDKRYIASIVFKQPIYQNIHILKLMQRRPQSTDPIGLDHADFIVDNFSEFVAELTKQKVPEWSLESNEIHGWISVWFNNTEAKYVDHIVLDVGVKELQEITQQLGYEPKSV
jgi:hypothetical protein